MRGAHDSELEALIAAAREDRLVLRRVSVAESELVFFKCVLEAHPGLGIVVAERDPHRSSDAGGRRAELTVIGAHGCDADIDDLLAELDARPVAACQSTGVM
jgi:hypothetical protein